MVNYIPKGNYLLFREKRRAYRFRKFKCGQGAKSICKRIRMRRQPKARTTKSKSRQEDFYEIKDKAQSRRKENKVELEINMERMGSKIIELHKIQEIQGPCHG
jgi:ATP-binding cassette subfamily F protein uup